ncbi:Ni-sirohydrochlorin a,c-diamide synthase [Methanothermococcus okinawensis]|uniref:Cobyrinate a,c-diamide synthase n=1 Tax=Methanothermococcus okinawensis (strain DSM 14208 / JCM 11175 / IH1) TaxID=647113 RepID=F8AML7_METOI|nr:Ni-sirohydrochlorin a,c-diamide synthase [Methanothermococcus okinawensis]AEH06058.1 Cobyrinic acid A,C-diamide synthase [Methanothermococcus okinawensis IH1]
MKDFKRVVLAGTSSMVGKTTISTGIMKALSKKYNVQPYKIGPDYIDPTYHTLATGNYSRNLDSFFMEDYQIRELFKRNSKNKDISIIEGVRGLYEGISPYNDVGSTASVSKSLNAPVILIMDARSLTRSAAAIIKGFKSFDEHVNIQGVIFNKIRGKNHYKKLKDAVKHYIPDIEIIGAIPRDEKLEVSQRHLGLVPTPENRDNINKNIDMWGHVVEEYLDLDKIVEISEKSENNELGSNYYNNNHYNDFLLWNVNKNRCTIGIAYDEVFNFYYWDNFDALEENGAKLKFFSPLNDESIPNCDILYFGGGYPEIFANELNKNKSMIESIRNFDGKIYGECGGLMYLTNSINGIEMLKMLNCDAIMTKNVQGLSYVNGTFIHDCPTGKIGGKFRAHEFHYSKLINIKEKLFAYKINRGKGIINNMDGILSNNGRILGGYAHQHCVGNPYFASSIVEDLK